MLFEGQKLTLKPIEANYVFLNRKNVFLNELYEKQIKLDGYMKQYF